MSRSVEVRVHNYNDNGLQIVDLDDDLTLGHGFAGSASGSSESGDSAGLLSEWDVQAVEHALVGALDSYSFEEFAGEGEHAAAGNDTSEGRDSASDDREGAVARKRTVQVGPAGMEVPITPCNNASPM